MRRLALLAAALLTVGGGGCANIGSPPGGPVRTTPPVVVRVTPDSGAVDVRDRGVVFEFDAVVSDRGLDALFLISPREGTPGIRWRRSRVEVRPGDDFRPNTAYSVTMLPGISDLNNNVSQEPRTVVFSTGPTIPRYAVLGRVFDWMSERVAPNALIEAMRLPDSLPYVGFADSVGQFSIGPLDSGTYSVRAMMDNNKNRAIDVGEPWDSALVVVRGVSPILELLAAPRDTIAPRLLTVTSPDTLTLVASFDRPLDANQSFASALRVVRSDSTPLRVARVSTRVQLDSAQRAVREAPAPPATPATPATPPTPAAPADTTALRDTTAGARPLDPRLERLRAGAAPQIRPSRRAPPQELTIRLDSLTPMRPGATYRVTATEIRGFLGRSRTSDRTVTLADARRDTSAVVPPPTVRPP